MGQLKKLLLNLNDQYVFDSDWNVIKPRDPRVISLNLDMPGRPYSGHTATETLYQFLSTGKTKVSLSMLVGVSKVEFNLDKERFDELLDITRERLEKNYKNATWLDVLMLLLIRQLFRSEEKLNVWATHHLMEMNRINPDLSPFLKMLSNEKVEPDF